MFCRNCGKEVDAAAIACPSCGASPQQETKFCQNCGAETKANQVLCVKCGVSLAGATGTGEKNKMAAGLIGIFLGALGIHKFYLGYTGPGLVMILISVIGGIVTFGIATGVMGIIGLIEGIVYLTKTDSEFYATYVAKKKGWF